MITVALTWNLALAMFKRTRPQKKKKTGQIGDAEGDNLYAVLLVPPGGNRRKSLPTRRFSGVIDRRGRLEGMQILPRRYR